MWTFCKLLYGYCKSFNVLSYFSVYLCDITGSCDDHIALDMRSVFSFYKGKCCLSNVIPEYTLQVLIGRCTFLQTTSSKLLCLFHYFLPRRPWNPCRVSRLVLIALTDQTEVPFRYEYVKYSQFNFNKLTFFTLLNVKSIDASKAGELSTAPTGFWSVLVC